MAPVPLFSSVETASLPPGPVHLAIGIFDGVHRGHRAVIEAAVRAAARDGGRAAVLTFRPHPSVVLRPDQPARLILGAQTLAGILAELGIGAVITHPFTPEFAHMEAADFLPWLKRCLPRLAGVYVGRAWRFGRGRRGDVAVLEAAARPLGVAVVGAPAVVLDGEPVTSTRIRTCLESGEVAAANTLLGYCYFSEGRVAPGKRLGRTLGFPTLNLPWAPELLPRFGVYRVRVRGGSSALPGIANYGLRPTVERAVSPLLETHVLGSCPWGDGDPIRVEWVDFVRPELKFASVEALREQIGRDIAAARAIL